MERFRVGARSVGNGTCTHAELAKPNAPTKKGLAIPRGYAFRRQRILKKSNDFEAWGGSGTAGDRKSIVF